MMTVSVVTEVGNAPARLWVFRLVVNSEEFGKIPRAPKMSGTDDLPICGSDAVSPSNRRLKGAG